MAKYKYDYDWITANLAEGEAKGDSGDYKWITTRGGKRIIMLTDSGKQKYSKLHSGKESKVSTAHGKRFVSSLTGTREKKVATEQKHLIPSEMRRPDDAVREWTLPKPTGRGARFGRMPIRVNPLTGERSGRGIARIPEGKSGRARMVAGYAVAGGAQGLLNTAHNIGLRGIKRAEEYARKSPAERARYKKLRQKYKAQRTSRRRSSLEAGRDPHASVGQRLAEETGLNVGAHALTNTKRAVNLILAHHPIGMAFQMKTDPADARTSLEFFLQRARGNLYNRMVALHQAKAQLDMVREQYPAQYTAQMEDHYQDTLSEIKRLRDIGGRKYKNSGWFESSLLGEWQATKDYSKHYHDVVKEREDELKAQGIAPRQARESAQEQLNRELKSLGYDTDAYLVARDVLSDLVPEIVGEKGEPYPKPQEEEPTEEQEGNFSVDELREKVGKLCSSGLTKEEIVARLSKAVTAAPVSGLMLTREDLAGKMSGSPRRRKRRRKRLGKVEKGLARRIYYGARRAKKAFQPHYWKGRRDAFIRSRLIYDVPDLKNVKLDPITFRPKGGRWDSLSPEFKTAQFVLDRKVKSPSRYFNAAGRYQRAVIRAQRNENVANYVLTGAALTGAYALGRRKRKKLYKVEKSLKSKALIAGAVGAVGAGAYALGRRSARPNFTWSRKMERVPVNSSNIKSVGYDPVTRSMEVEFHGGRVYRYPSISAKTHRDLMNAESKGSYFHHNIRANYPYKRMR